MTDRRAQYTALPLPDCKLKWGNDTTQTSVGYSLYLGRWKVGGVRRELSSRGIKDKWVAKCYLPGMPCEIAVYDDLDEAQRLVENSVKFWLCRINEEDHHKMVDK